MTTNPPTDEVMCKIVAKVEQWDEAFLEEGVDLDDDTFVPHPEWYMTEFKDKYTVGGKHPGVADPRTDTDAALELLHWLFAEDGSSSAGARVANGEWITQCYKEHETHIPISGEPFRTAICNLAASVMEVE